MSLTVLFLFGLYIYIMWNVFQGNAKFSLKKQSDENKIYFNNKEIIISKYTIYNDRDNTLDSQNHNFLRHIFHAGERISSAEYLQIIINHLVTTAS